MKSIEIRLPDKSIKEFHEGSSSADVAKSIGEGLLRASVAAKIDGVLVDLYAPIENSSNIELITNKSPEAHEILLHSTAHLLAQAIKEIYPKAKIAIGPALEDRFYYDIDFPEFLSEEELYEFSLIKELMGNTEPLNEFSSLE